ncbi:PilN domain-containing protein [Glaciimonas immobilis]|uniref:MSHA biogenesis protein MshA n=1 Tax=Glaciimonas immobilis TaxID=728004 RepID=A0A840RPH5_9BURK|nr:PilN domain-containing protein [Glaciimonas immobilis]KAF3998991.1 PilN domain-containing protein [Glaciimonas immobilis]MBB5198409.1 hypothetical protein [Glaciimonas immobilis]
MSQQINLFNPLFLKQKKYFSAVAMVQALGLILLGALCISTFSDYEFSSIRNDEVTSTAQVNVVQAELTKVSAQYVPNQKDQLLADRITKANLEIKFLQQASETLNRGDFGNTLGYSAYLLAFSRQIVDGVWLSGFSIVGAGAEMDLRGLALRPELVPTYIDKLKNEPIMQGKTFSTLEMHIPSKIAGDTTGLANAPSVAPYFAFDLRSSGLSKEKAITPVAAPPTVSPSMTTPGASAPPDGSAIKKPAETGGVKRQ